MACAAVQGWAAQWDVNMERLSGSMQVSLHALGSVVGANGALRFTCATSILYYHASYCGPLLVQPLFSKTKNWRSNARVRGVCECARA